MRSTSQTMLPYFKKWWSNVLYALFYGGFNGVKYCHIFVEQVFLVQVLTKYLVKICLANKQARSFRCQRRLK